MTADLRQAARVLHHLTNLVLPERCAACGSIGAGLCPGCRRAATLLRLPGGGPVRLAPRVLAIAAFGYDGVIARAIRDVKTPGRHRPARHLADLLWATIAGIAPGAIAWPRTWVPSTARRVRERGADIPRLLAGQGAVALLRRTHQVSDQTMLSADQRRVARQGDFEAGHGVPSCVVLVDDVRTTGGTASAAAAALTGAGADRVLVVTLAVAGVVASTRRVHGATDVDDA